MKIETVWNKEIKTVTTEIVIEVPCFNLTLTLEEAQRVTAMIGSFSEGAYKVYDLLDEAIKNAGEDADRFVLRISDKADLNGNHPRLVDTHNEEQDDS